eukprot:Opistho-1_new@75101
MPSHKSRDGGDSPSDGVRGHPRRRKQSSPMRAIRPREQTARRVPMGERTFVLRFKRSELKLAQDGGDSSDKQSAENGKGKRARRGGQPLDISGMPMLERLSAEEQELASTVRVTPEQYLKIKDTIISEAKKVFLLKKSHATRLFRIDSNKTARLYEYFVKMGWIKNGSAPS